ncbi:MAG: aldehyde dehydrogenase family protein, partial [Acidimicrobiaceae bacterium]|nr:aldehyde dehydrogenase family protein [Acidimicrobiaceae bacterium]
MWIDGRAAASADGGAARRDDVCPSTGAVLARVHQASGADVDRAVAAAARSQPAWAAMGIHERAARLAEWGRRVVEAAPRLGLLDARDGGTAV